jgi:hypothetical protein
MYVIAGNGTWAVSVFCMATASCVPHVGLWTIAHTNVVRIKVAVIYMAPLPAAYCFRTNKMYTKQQATDVTSWTVRRGNMRSDGRVLEFRAFLIPSDACFKVNSRRVELFAHWCSYKEWLNFRSLRVNMAGLRLRSAAARLPRLWVRIPWGV